MIIFINKEKECLLKKKKEFIYQFTRLRDLSLNLYRKYYVKDYIPNTIYEGIFIIDGQEVLVYLGDYLVEYKGRLYYYPKDIYESRTNKDIVGVRRR